MAQFDAQPVSEVLNITQHNLKMYLPVIELFQNTQTTIQRQSE
jgi:hypothetical protein